MTYNTKNTTLVFVFASILMLMPFGSGNVFGEEMDASLNGSCGFTTSDAGGIDFGSFDSTDDAATVGEVDAEFPALNGTTSSARVSVSVGDWYGTGTRATGSITLDDAHDSFTYSAGLIVIDVPASQVTVGSYTYIATDTVTSGSAFYIGGTDAQDASELASLIRSTDSENFNVSTGGTDTVSVEYITRGTPGNSIVLSENSEGTTIITADASGDTTSNLLSGAVDTPQIIMNGDITKFTWDITGAQDTSYNNKTAIDTVDVSQEVLGGTDPSSSLFLAIMIDPSSATFTNLPYDGALTQEITITVESACDGT